MSIFKIIIITNGNYFARLILDNLFRRRAALISGVMIVSGDYKARTGLKALWEIGKQAALPYLIYKVFCMVTFNIAQHFYPRSAFSVERLSKRYGASVCRVVSVNSDEAFDWVALKEPDLLVSVSCPQMIKRKLLTLARNRGINIHSSLLPTYAGLAPYFWVLRFGEKITGATVHYMTSRFDEGNILVQNELDIQPKESAFHLFKRLAELGNGALLEAVDIALLGNSGTKQDSVRYSYFSNPSFCSYLELRKRGHCLLRWKEIFAAVQQEAQRLAESDVNGGKSD